jgi:putative peptide-modifying radical SAM enzyme
MPYIVEDFVYFHIILTDECNLCCSYCRAKAFEVLDQSEGEKSVLIDGTLPLELAYDLKVLYEFLRKDPSPSLTFYGGEPLLRTELIQKIIRDAPVQQFMIQTNGLLLHNLPPETTNRFSVILVSLDGERNLTDVNRGNGVYDRVMENVRKIRANGYTGELIARMTVTERTDIVDAVHHLANNPEYSFASIHWQIDANFAGDFSRRTFENWAKSTYNPGITTLVNEWVDQMENCGEVRRWYPFLDPMEDLLNERTSMLRCGSGYTNYSIMTDGHIGPCPIMIGMHEYYVGHISRSHPLKLKHIPIGGECSSCRIRTFCGGRCLYSNITQPWEANGRSLVCMTVEHLCKALNDALPRVRALLDDRTIKISDFSHQKFNGCEIIP